MTKQRSDTLSVALATVAAEADALHMLGDTIDEGLDAAVDTILAARGRVIVTGMGKSGHVARRIAAGLTSTGTPSAFLHPAEAVHGDLGTVMTDDVLLALSASGETAEILPVLDHCARFGVPVVAITRVPSSTLGKRADAVIRIPEVPEACPIGLAPTTSATTAAAAGDALMTALTNARGFTPENFRRLHPGGALGRRLTDVRHLMRGRDDVPRVDRDVPVRDAIVPMTVGRLGCAAAVDEDGHLVGVITDGDLRRILFRDRLDDPVRDVMTGEPVTVDADAPASEALRTMNERRITAVFVLDDDGRPSGALHVHDCLRAGIV